MPSFAQQLNILMIKIIREKLIISKLKALLEKHQSTWWCKGLLKVHPNLITFSRATIFPVLVIFSLLAGHKLTALLFWILGWLTDILDGPWAEVTNKQSELGKKLDPLCDRLYFLAVLFLCLLYFPLSQTVVVFLCLIVALDLALPSLYLVAKRIGISPKLEHDAFGKTKTTMAFLVVPLIWFSKNTINWQSLLAGVAATALFCSLVTIVRHLLKHYQTNKP